MHLQAWLKSYITRAFDGVTLDDGVDIHTAKFLDSYGFDDEELLRDRAWMLPFLDTKGFRFYMPVMMIDIIENERLSDLPQTFFYELKIDRFGRFKDLPFADVFNRHQQAAIARFLKFLLYNRGWNRDGDAGKLFTRLTDLRQQVAQPSDAPKLRNRRH